MQRLLKTPAEAEGVRCEHHVCVALCARKRRFLPFVYSETAVGDGAAVVASIGSVSNSA